MGEVRSCRNRGLKKLGTVWRSLQPTLPEIKVLTSCSKRILLSVWLSFVKVVVVIVVFFFLIIIHNVAFCLFNLPGIHITQSLQLILRN